MATLGASFVDLIDVYKSQYPDGTIAEVIELLTERNEVLTDAMAVECNNGTRHIHTIRTGLPSVTWGQLYKGINQSKSTKAQVTDVTGFVEGMSTIDKRLLKLNPGKEGYIRMQEAAGFVESMNQEIATGIFYHNQATDPEKFTGLGPRYNSLSAETGNNIIDAGGTGSDNTSVWFVTWGDMFTHLIYPEGTTAGIDREDKGEQRVLDGSNNPYYVVEECFTWHVGLCVKDWRYNSRIANIDVPNLQDGSVDIYKYMRQAYWKLQSRRVPGGRQSIYCNADVMEQLDAWAHNQGTGDAFVRLKPMEIQGQEVLTYRGIPIRETDAILNTEAQIV
jgi:hypothetical protein